MKTTISRFVAISALVLALPLSAFAYGQGGDMNGRGGHGRAGAEMNQGHGLHNLRGIDLTSAQVGQLSALRDDQRKSFADKAPAMREQHDALRKLVMSDAYTPAAAAEIITKIGATQSEMAKFRAEQDNKLFKILTPEQRTRMQQNELTGGGAMGRGHKR